MINIPALIITLVSLKGIDGVLLNGKTILFIMNQTKSPYTTPESILYWLINLIFEHSIKKITVKVNAII